MWMIFWGFFLGGGGGGGGGKDLFENEIMNPLRSIYEIRTEHVNSFKYLGLNIKQNND